MRSIVFLTVLFSMFFGKVFSQNINIDSVKNLIQTATHDTTRIIILSDLCFNLSESNAAEAIKYGKQAVELGEKTSNKNYLAYALMHLGNAYRNYSDFNTALDCFHKSQTIYKSKGDNERVLMVLMNEANVYWNQGNLDKAIKINLEVLKMAEQNNYPKMQITSLNNTGLAFTDKGEYKKASDYFGKALQVHRRYQLADSAHEYQNLGNCYYFMKENEKAGQYYTIALQLYQHDNDKRGMMRTLGNQGNILLEQNKPEEALAAYRESIATAELINDKVQVISILGNMAYAYSEISDFKNAAACCEKGISVAHELKSNKLAENLYYAYSDICIAAKNYEGAYQNLLRSWSLRDSIFNDERDRSVREMETKYETEKKDSQIKLLNSEKEKQFIVLVAILSGLALVIVFFILLYKRFRVIRLQKEVIELQKLEVEKQKHMVDERQKEILDSIYYAKRIQNSLLPRDIYIDRKLKVLKPDIK